MYTQLTLVHSLYVQSLVEMCGLFVVETHICIKDKRKPILSDLVTIAIPHNNTGDGTWNVAVESQCSASSAICIAFLRLFYCRKGLES